MVEFAVPRETVAGERRVAVIPEIVARIVSEGARVKVESSAGAAAFFADQDYINAGAEIVGADEVLAKAQVVLSVQPLTLAQIDKLSPGAISIAFQYPHLDSKRVEALSKKGVTSLAMEWIPRISRAQSMDALSSQATVAGYIAVLQAAQLSSRFFPMLTTAAGTIRPAKVLVMGVGVAGLQAIATAKRLGANVSAYDVRKAAAEQALSLGAKVIELPISAEGEGGYARELTPEEVTIQQQALTEKVSEMDCIITTAQIPGKKAPILISKAMVEKLRPGALIFDLAAESGGNCEYTKPGEVVSVAGVQISGPLNLPSQLPIHASEMYAKNLLNLIKLLVKDSELNPDWTDEILAGSLLTLEGKISSRQLAQMGVEA